MAYAVVVSETTDVRNVEMLRRPPDPGRVTSETRHETGRWAPVRPAGNGSLRDVLWVVDGVQRQEVTVAEVDIGGKALWVGGVGAAASGAVRLSPGQAGQVRLVTVDRLLFSPVRGGTQTGELLTSGGVVVREVFCGKNPPFGGKLDSVRAELEKDTRRAAQKEGGWVLVDGLYKGSHPRTVGVAKQHERKYLTDAQYEVVEQLAVGERTPLFRFRDRTKGDERAWSWYSRIQSNRYGPWSGLVRLETNAPFDAALTMADLFTRWLPGQCARIGTPRAPENLTPIGGLEKHLRKRLGNTGLVRRAVTRASQQQRV